MILDGKKPSSNKESEVDKEKILNLAWENNKLCTTRGATRGIIWRSGQSPLHVDTQQDKTFALISKVTFNNWFPFSFLEG